MKHLILVIISFVMSFLSHGQDLQHDSLKVFFYGNIKGEKFEVYWNGRLILKFKGSGSYKYSFKIPKENSWEKRGYIEKLSIYRKGRFDLKYREVGFTSGFEQKRYLII